MCPTAAAPTPAPAPAPAKARSAWQEIAGTLRGEHYDYTQGALPRAILLLAVPMVLEMALEATFALVDIGWVNRIEDGWFGATPTGGKAVAAIGATESLMAIVFAIAFGVGFAVTALVARRIGEKYAHGASVAGAQAIGLGPCSASSPACRAPCSRRTCWAS
jgi:Na+-driven multidrug efflux pump